MRICVLRAIGAALSFSFIFGSHAIADEAVEKFYKGKTIAAVVPFAAGGGYAIYNQIVTRHLGKYIPGNPQLVPQYRPGAGGIVAANYLYNSAPSDGTVIGMVSDSVALASVIDAEKIKYKVNEFVWLGAIERVNNVLGMRADIGVRGVKDMRAKEVILGSSGTGSPTYLLPALLSWLEPVKIRTIFGFAGVNPILLAIERNEIGGVTVSWTIFKSLRKQWFDSGYMLPIVQFGSVREKDLPNVPLAIDFAKTPQQQAVARFMASNVDVGRSFVVPPGVPAERVAALRAAFDKMVKDQAYIDEMIKAGFQPSPASGAEVQDAVAKATTLDANLTKTIRGMVAKSK
jgi:tripartite-type tricarboxylate transporter receptor subunit TctC